MKAAAESITRFPLDKPGRPNVRAELRRQHAWTEHQSLVAAGSSAGLARLTSVYRASQGSGLNVALAGSFLKCVLWTNGSRRFSGSFVSVTIVSQTSPLGAVIRW